MQPVQPTAVFVGFSICLVKRSDYYISSSLPVQIIYIFWSAAQAAVLIAFALNKDITRIYLI